MKVDEYWKDFDIKVFEKLLKEDLGNLEETIDKQQRKRFYQEGINSLNLNENWFAEVLETDTPIDQWSDFEKLELINEMLEDFEESFFLETLQLDKDVLADFIFDLADKVNSYTGYRLELIKAYNKGLKFNPDSIRGQLQLSKVYLKQNEGIKALSYLNRVISIERSIPVLTLSSYAYFLEKQYENALPLLEEALEREPQNLDILHNYGTSLYKMERLEEAKRVFQKMTEIRPDEIIARRNFLKILHRKQEVETLAKELKKIDKSIVQRDLRTFRAYGHYFAKKGKYQEAISIFEKCLMEPKRFDPFVLYDIEIHVEEYLAISSLIVLYNLLRMGSELKKLSMDYKINLDQLSLDLEKFESDDKKRVQNYNKEIVLQLSKEIVLQKMNKFIDKQISESEFRESFLQFKDHYKY